MHDRSQIMSAGRSRFARAAARSRRRNPIVPFIACAAWAALALGAGSAGAQHETAYDVSDGARAYQSICANCHGPDGDLIAGMDFSRGVFRRPLTDEDIARIIINGLPNTPMPPTPNMSEAQAVEIVAYLRSMPMTRAAPGHDVAVHAAALPLE